MLQCLPFMCLGSDASLRIENLVCPVKTLQSVTCICLDAEPKVLSEVSVTLHGTTVPR